MRKSLLAWVALATVAGVSAWLAPAHLAGQEGYVSVEKADRACPMIYDFSAFHRCALEKMKTFEPPRTADGKPDMSGRWATTKTALDIEGFEAGVYLSARGGFHPFSHSFTVDPPNGQVPYQPWARAAKDTLDQRYMSNVTMCFPRGVGRFIVGSPEIIQQPNQIVFLNGESDGYLVVPLDGRPGLSSAVKLWGGDAHGHWESDTLVLDIKNVNDLIWFDHQGTFITENTHIVERFTYVDANTIHVEAVIEDPSVFTQSWKMVMPLTRVSPKQGFDALALENTSVEYCEGEMRSFYHNGLRPFPGYKAAVSWLRPKVKSNPPTAEKGTR